MRLRKRPRRAWRNLLEPGAAQRRGAEVLLGLGRDPGDDGKEQLSEPLVVLVEHPYDLLVRHRGRPLNPDVVVRHHRDVRVAELELTREEALGIGGHIYHVPAHLLEPLRLRARRETRALDDDDGTLVASLDSELAGGLDQEPSQFRTVRVRGG